MLVTDPEDPGHHVWRKYFKVLHRTSRNKGIIQTKRRFHTENSMHIYCSIGLVRCPSGTRNAVSLREHVPNVYLKHSTLSTRCRICSGIPRIGIRHSGTVRIFRASMQPVYACLGCNGADHHINTYMCHEYSVRIISIPDSIDFLNDTSRSYESAPVIS